MRETTLCFLVRGDEVLLAMKKRGFGAGKWNGYGGKLDEGETLLQGAVREIKEESGISVSPNELGELGVIDFYFTDKEEWNQRVHIFRILYNHTEPQETEEMKPRWFSFSDIPYNEMWAGDDAWFTHFLRGEKFSGDIHFANEGKKVLKIDISKQ